MNIALIGYGKMGKEIEKMSIERGHDIVLKVLSSMENYSLDNIDVAIEFSTPESAFRNIKKCIDSGVPVVCGTTGWLDKYDNIVKYCNEKKSAFLYSSNFSIGVNIFFEINKKLSSLIKNKGYDVSIREIHHLQKLDKPSGTSITLANDILEDNNKVNWSIDEKDKDKLFIESIREENVVGKHIVKYSSDIDNIEIKHEAHNRKGFALGALTASEWIVGKRGIFSMRDVLNI